MTTKKTATTDSGEVFKTITRVPIDSKGEIDKLSRDAEISEEDLGDKKGQLGIIKDQIKELVMHRNQIITDIIEKKRSVEVDAIWRIDWDKDKKDLIGFYEGKEILIETAELTEFDRQMKFPTNGL